MVLRLWLTRHGLLISFGSVLPRIQLHTDGVGSGFMWTVSTFLPDYTASQLI